MYKFFKIFIGVLYYICYTVFFIGFLDYRYYADLPGFGLTKYCIILGILFLGFGVPPLICWIFKKLDKKHACFCVFFTIIITFSIYLGFCTRYYYTQQHLFDIFLQMPPPTFRVNAEDRGSKVFRILTLGGSTTNNQSLPEDHSYPVILEDILQEHYADYKIEVYNAGVPWYTTKHSLINYVSNLRNIRPHLVIVMHGINDLYRSFSPADFAIGEYNPQWSHYYGSAINAANPVTFERKLILDLLGGLSSGWYYSYRYLKRDLPLERYKSLKQFETNLSYLVHYLKTDQVNVILMTQPSLYKKDLDEKEQAVLYFGKVFCNENINWFQREYPSAQSLFVAMKKYNSFVKEMAKLEDIYLIDLESQVEKTLENFVDDVHYTSIGANKVAEIVAGEVIQFGVLD